jgi:TRAP-type C4-dicarboxylate transport system permease small subunit
MERERGKKLEVLMTKNLRWIVIHFEEVLCAILFGIMSIIAFVNVISRYWLKYSLAFTEELLISFFVWVTLLGAAVAFREGSNLGFNFVTDRLPQKIQKILIWISALLGAILFSFLIYFSIYQVKEEIVLKITSMGIGVPQWWYTIGMPVWSVLVIIRIFQGAYRKNQQIGRT